MPPKRGFNADSHEKHSRFSKTLFWWLFQANSKIPMDAEMVFVGIFFSRSKRMLDNLGSKFSDLCTVLSQGNVTSLLAKGKGVLSDFATASVAGAKAFGKTYAEESGKYANTFFCAFGGAAAGGKILTKATIAGVKDAKSALRMVKDQENGLVEAVRDAEKAAELSKIAKSTEDLLKATTCSTEDLVKYLKSCDNYFKTNYAEQFLETGKWPDNIQIPKSADVLTSDGGIDWSQVPCDGYTTKTVKEYDKLTGEIVNKRIAIKDEYTPQVGEIIDRYGSSDGRYTSPTKDGIFSYDQRSLPYLEDASKYHQYEVTEDFNNLQKAIENCTNSELKSEIDNFVKFKYNGDYSKFYSSLKTWKGEIASGFGSTGGGIQYELALRVDWLEKLGFLNEIK